MREYIKLVVDGSCIRQQGVGGWAYRFEFRDKVYSDSKGVEHTTNNEMELEAAHQGLLAIHKVTRPDMVDVLIVSDSKYVVNGATDWIENWRRRRWTTLEGKPVANRELWERIDDLTSAFHTARWKWVKGHNGHELNEIVDEMANDAARAMQRRPVYVATSRGRASASLFRAAKPSGGPK